MCVGDRSLPGGTDTAGERRRDKKNKTSAGEGRYFGFDHSFEIFTAVSERRTSGREEGRGN